MAKSSLNMFVQYLRQKIFEDISQYTINNLSSNIFDMIINNKAIVQDIIDTVTDDNL